MSYRIQSTANLNLIHVLDAQVFDYSVDDPVDTNGVLWWVVLDDKTPVAYAGLKVLGDYGFLSRAGVLPGHRGKGLQVRLIRVRLAYAKRMLLKTVSTYTLRENVVSSNNLIRCGFKLYIPTLCWGGKSALYWYNNGG